MTNNFMTFSSNIEAVLTISRLTILAKVDLKSFYGSNFTV